MDLILKHKRILIIMLLSIIICGCSSIHSVKHMNTSVTEPEVLSKRPCWLKSKPENCEKIKNIPGNWIFLVDYIITQNQSEEMTEHQQRALHNQLTDQYIAKLESKIISEIKYYAECINEETNDQCNTLFQNKHQLISKGTVQSNEIEICEIFWEKSSTSDEWKLFGLGKFDKRRYLEILNLVLKGKSLSPKQKIDPIKPSEMKYAYSLSSPSEMTDIFEIPKYIEDPEEIETCNDIQIKFTDLPKLATLDDCISSIQNSLKKIYSQRRAGIYLDDRILETNSECMKREHGCISDHDYEFVEDEMEKEYFRILSCWKNSIKSLDVDYINKKKEALLEYKATHHDVTRLGVSLI